MCKDERQFKTLIEQLDIDTMPSPAFKQALRTRMLAEFENEALPSQSQETWRLSWRSIMKSPLARLTTAAVIGVAVVIAFLGEGKSGVVVARMLEKLAGIQSYAYESEWTIEQEGGSAQVIRSKVYISQDHGQRSDTYLGDQILTHTYTPIQGNQIIQVFPGSKKYMKLTLTEAQILEMRQRSDPRTWLADLREFHTEDLGSKVEDGREIIGIEIDDPVYLAFLFEQAKGQVRVDVGTQLPVRMVVEATSAQGGIKNHILATNFDWNTPLDRSIFEPNIPEDYTLNVDASLSDSEENALQGLRSYASVTGGLYPSSLDLMTAMREMVMTLLHKRSLDPYAEEPTDPTIPYNSAEMQQLVALRATCSFFGNLKKDQTEVVYYGEKIQAHHADKVLLRWLQADGQYRVIFGDLHVEVLSPVVLEDLEQDEDFRSLLDAPRRRPQIEAPGNCKGESQVDRYYVSGDQAQVTSVIEQPTWSPDEGLLLRLPYKEAVLTSVVAGERQWPFEKIAPQTYRIIDLAPQWPQVTYTWTVAIADLEFDPKMGGYRAILDSGVPVRSLQLKVAIDPEGSWDLTHAPGKSEFTPFSSGKKEVTQFRFGRCSLTIKPRE